MKRPASKPDPAAKRRVRVISREGIYHEGTFCPFGVEITVGPKLAERLVAERSVREVT